MCLFRNVTIVHQSVVSFAELHKSFDWVIQKTLQKSFDNNITRCYMQGEESVHVKGKGIKATEESI